MAFEDFKNDYTEVDPGTYINADTADTRADFIGIPLDGVDAYFYKDFGASHFTNFTHLIDFYLSSTNLGTQSSVCGYSITVNVDNGADITFGMMVYLVGSTVLKTISLRNNDDLETDQSDISLDTIYYTTPIRNGTAFSVETYSDSGRTNLLDTIAVTGTASALRYIMAAQSYDFEAPGDRSVTGYMKDLDLQEVVVGNVPEIMNHYRRLRTA